MKTEWMKRCHIRHGSLEVHLTSWRNLYCRERNGATSSAYDLYALDPSEPMPKAGDYSVILNSFDEAVCVFQTVETEMIPFNEISERHALLEGEGDLSLAW